MDLETLAVQARTDGTVLVTIARPEKLNAMNHAFFHELPAVLAGLDADPDVSVCVITGAGEAFSAGGDIADFDRLTDTAAYRRQVRLALGAFHAVERAETIVIAAVNGLAYGGGTELTLACDLGVASTSARFAFREVTVGLQPGYGLVRGPEVIGRAWTRRLALTGEIIDADQALRLGLVQQVAAPERLLDDALALAAIIAAHPTTAVQVGKQFLNRDVAGINEAVEATALLFTTPEHKQRIRAFLEKSARRK
jgi:enoyl-CoA hydratase/carnithine racemase